MNLDHFGMDTITLAGPLEAKLAAIRAAGFTQVMLNANDLAGHPGGAPAAIEAVRRSGLRVTGFQVLRDFEGLSGHLHAYKVDIAKAMLQMCHDLGAPDVPAATKALKDRGVVFVDRGPVQPSEKGALTQVYLGGVTFELVVSHLKP